MILCCVMSCHVMPCFTLQQFDMIQFCLNINVHTHPHIYTQALVLPFNILVSKLAKDMEDRAMMVNLNYLSFLRCGRVS